MLSSRKKKKPSSKQSELKDTFKYYKLQTFKEIRSLRDLFIFLLNPLRLENEIREKRKLYPYWKKIPSDIVVRYKNSYGLFIKEQKKPLIVIKNIQPYTTSYLKKLGDLYLVRYYNKRKKIFMELSEHGEFFGTSYSGNTHLIERPEEKYKQDYDKQIKIIKQCINDLKKYAYLSWRYSLIEKYIKILEEKREKIKSKKTTLLKEV